MRTIFLFLFAVVLMAFEAQSQDSIAARYRRQTIRLYGQAGMMFSRVNMINPRKQGVSYFESKGVTHPVIGLGAIIEAKMDKPKFYLGVGVAFMPTNYSGERYVKFISPSAEELEVYDARHRSVTIDLFAGYYFWLNDLWAIKPQLGLAVMNNKNTLEWDVYEYQTDNVKRSHGHLHSETKLAGQVSLFFSFRKRFEIGPTYFSPSSLPFSGSYAARFRPFGGVVRYIHSF